MGAQAPSDQRTQVLLSVLHSLRQPAMVAEKRVAPETEDNSVAKKAKPVVSKDEKLALIKTIIQLMDLTSLGDNDTEADINKLIEQGRSNSLQTPTAAFCIYSKFTKAIETERLARIGEVTELRKVLEDTSVQKAYI